MCWSELCDKILIENSVEIWFKTTGCITYNSPLVTPNFFFLGKFLHFVKFLFHKIWKSLFYQGNFNWICCLFWGKFQLNSVCFQNIFHFGEYLISQTEALDPWAYTQSPKMEFHLLSLSSSKTRICSNLLLKIH